MEFTVAPPDSLVPLIYIVTLCYASVYNNFICAVILKLAAGEL